MPRRTVLFSPGDKPDLMRKAPDTGADVVVFDLEDAVVPDRKAAARAHVATVLSEIDPACEVCVRVNPTGIAADDDLAAVIDADARLDSVMLPKAESAADVDDLDALVAEHDASLPILAIAESAAGVLHAEAIAGADATSAVCFGAEDYAADVGASRTEEGTEVLYAREHVVAAAGAADVDVIDTLVTDFRAEERLREDTRFGLELGYDGKMVIHPDQVAVVNEAYTPSEERVAWAERVLEAQATAAAEDVGVYEVDGEMIDAPLVAQAEQLIERAEAAGQR
jgi:citrate lyase subunit beta/citryl-CoA lyase